MPASVSIEVSDRKVIDYVAQLRAKVDNLKPAMEDVGENVEQKVRLLFVDSEDPYGRPWKPLKFRRGQPLRDTSQLMNSITHRATKDEVEVGTGLRYAHVHQFGADIRPVRAKRLVFTPRGFSHPIFAKRVSVPARPFLPQGALPEKWRMGVLLVLQRYLGAAKQGAASA